MKSIGDKGEQIAEKYLRNHGYNILVKNYKIYGWEIDIIAKKNEVWVFVEVKFRKNAKFVHPMELWTHQKQRAFLRAMYSYIGENNIDEDDCQIDFIAILPQEKSYKLFHKKWVELL